MLVFSYEQTIQDALKLRKGDLDHIVDELSDGEGDEDAGRYMYLLAYVYGISGLLLTICLMSINMWVFVGI